MLGKRWSDEEQRRYRTCLSVYRITDEAWGLLALTEFFVFVFLWPRLWLPVFMVSGLFMYLLFPLALSRVFPAHVNDALPRDRFDGPLGPQTPRSYLDLLRLWQNPAWRSTESFHSEPHPAPFSVQIAILTSVLAVIAIQSTLQFALAPLLMSHGAVWGAIFVGGICIAGVVAICGWWRTRVSERSFTSPGVGEIWAVGLAGVAASALTSLLAVLRLGA